MKPKPEEYRLCMEESTGFGCYFGWGSVANMGGVGDTHKGVERFKMGECPGVTSHRSRALYNHRYTTMVQY